MYEVFVARFLFSYALLFIERFYPTSIAPIGNTQTT